MSFDQAFGRTVGLEKGYSNHPSDRGGKTRWGVTETVARAAGYVGSMEDLPIATAKAIIRPRYWDLLHLDQVDQISPGIAAEIFDTAVNCGVGVPIAFLQRALNAFNRRGKDYPDMPVDGLNGPTTIDALRAFLHVRGALGEKVMVTAMNSQQGVRYFEIAERRPDQEDFEFGWWAQRVAL